MTNDGAPKIEVEADDAIFLIGFMGAGKTTVGRVLAKKIGYEFLDLDEFIEAKTGKSISDIFTEFGEDEFRRLERETIKSFHNLKRTVMALGGGAYVSEENRATFRRMGMTVWLDCPLEICLSRIASNTTRPLLANESEMRALLDSRIPTYSLADKRIETDACEPEQIADAIAGMLGLEAL